MIQPYHASVMGFPAQAEFTDGSISVITDELVAKKLVSPSKKGMRKHKEVNIFCC